MDDLDIQKLIEQQRAFDEQAGKNKAIMQGLQAVANVPSRGATLVAHQASAPKFTFGDDYKPEASPLEQMSKVTALKDKMLESETQQLQNAQRKQALAEEASLADPDGKLKKSLLTFYKSQGIDAPEDLGAKDLVKTYGSPKDILAENRKFDAQMKLAASREDAAMRMQAKKEAAAILKEQRKKEAETNASYADKLKGLNATEKQRYDNVMMVSKAVDAMQKALESGVNRYSVFGDNDFTANLTKGAEAFGRLQSGGAINKDEEARFMRMLRSVLDSPRIQRAKLSSMKNEMASRLATLGFNPAENPLFAGSAVKATPSMAMPSVAAPSRVPDRTAIEEEMKRRGLIK